MRNSDVPRRSRNVARAPGAPRSFDTGNPQGGTVRPRGDESQPSRPTQRPLRRARPATMQDIADALGVSQSTVSRVLTGSPTPVPINPVTRQRVLDMAGQMHYRPNPLARGLRGAKTMLLGVIDREIMDPFFAGAIDAISVEASKYRYNVVLGHVHGRTDEAIALRAVFETPHCDAIILVGDTSDQPRLLDDLREANTVVVGMFQGSAAMPGTSVVNVDNRTGVISLIDHLVSMGHRNMGFIGGAFSTASGRTLGDISERQATFVEYLQKLGIETPSDNIRDVQNNYAFGSIGFEELMALPNPPTAVLASTDVLAIGALRAAHRLGLRVPEDVSITGFDDLPLAEHLTPPLTTVRQPIAEMAAVAVKAAIQEAADQASGNTRRHISASLEPTLVIRESSGPVPARTPEHRTPTAQAHR